MDLQLQGKNVLVTGAGAGLGRFIGMAFAQEGANVAFHFNSSGEGAEEAALEARALGVSALAIGIDLTDPEAVPAGVATIESELGPLDILINNAAATQSKPFLETTEADWAPQVDVTVSGTIRLVHAVLGPWSTEGAAPSSASWATRDGLARAGC